VNCVTNGTEGMLLHKSAKLYIGFGKYDLLGRECFDGFGFRLRLVTVDLCNHTYLRSVGISKGNNYKRAFFDNVGEIVGHKIGILVVDTIRVIEQVELCVSFIHLISPFSFVMKRLAEKK
jgi:hypothetical protein